MSLTIQIEWNYKNHNKICFDKKGLRKYQAFEESAVQLFVKRFIYCIDIIDHDLCCLNTTCRYIPSIGAQVMDSSIFIDR